MNWKKIIILPLGFLFITLIEISCCNCKDQLVRPFIVFSNGSCTVNVNGLAVNTNQVINNDTILILNKYMQECVAKAATRFSFFNEAMACKCNIICGNNGFKKPFTQLRIVASSNFNSIASGQSINSNCSVNYYGATNNLAIPRSLTVAQFIDSVNTSKDYYKLAQLQIKVVKPIASFNGKLSIQYIFANTDTLTTISVPFTWQ